MKQYSTCEEVRDEFSALLDGELATDEQEGVEEHLSSCSDCLRELDGMKRVTDLYAELPVVPAPESLDISIEPEPDETVIDLRPTPSNVHPISFRPILSAVAMLTLLAGVSYVISQGMPATNQMEMAAEIPEAREMVLDEAEDLSLSSADAESVPMKSLAVSGAAEESLRMISSNPPAAAKRERADLDRPEVAAASPAPKMKVSEMQKEAPIDTFSDAFAGNVTAVEPDTLGFVVQSDGAWHEQGFTDQALTDLTVGDAAFVKATTQRPEVAAILVRTTVVVFQIEGTWYRVDRSPKTN